jgi:hypothetical protein
MLDSMREGHAKIWPKNIHHTEDNPKISVTPGREIKVLIYRAVFVIGI